MLYAVGYDPSPPINSVGLAFLASSFAEEGAEPLACWPEYLCAGVPGQVAMTEDKAKVLMWFLSRSGRASAGLGG